MAMFNRGTLPSYVLVTLRGQLRCTMIVTNPAHSLSRLLILIALMAMPLRLTCVPRVVNNAEFTVPSFSLLHITVTYPRASRYVHRLFDGVTVQAILKTHGRPAPMQRFVNTHKSKRLGTFGAYAGA